MGNSKLYLDKVVRALGDYDTICIGGASGFVFVGNLDDYETDPKMRALQDREVIEVYDRFITEDDPDNGVCVIIAGKKTWGEYWLKSEYREARRRRREKARRNQETD